MQTVLEVELRAIETIQMQYALEYEIAASLGTQRIAAQSFLCGSMAAAVVKC